MARTYSSPRYVRSSCSPRPSHPLQHCCTALGEIPDAEELADTYAVRVGARAAVVDANGLLAGKTHRAYMGSGGRWALSTGRLRARTTGGRRAGSRIAATADAKSARDDGRVRKR
jgi:hypothetical protein